MVDEFLKCIGSDSKRIDYLQSRLRGGKEIYEKGGHVTMKYADRTFSMEFDNRRIIKEKEIVDLSNILLDSSPFTDLEECKNLRSLKKLIKSIDFNKIPLASFNSKKHRTIIEAAARTFIKGLLAEEVMYGLDKSKLPTYDDIIEFIHGFEYTEKMPLTKSGISHLKNRKSIIKTIPVTKETLKFVEYIKLKFPDFEPNKFLIGENVKQKLEKSENLGETKYNDKDKDVARDDESVKKL
jgi:hypothetical protein